MGLPAAASLKRRGLKTTLTIYYVHVDHLMRPIRMTDQNLTWVWDVKYAPFGATTYLYTNPEVMNGRFPGQWFQLETGLAYNWHRHYDPTLGRYIQPDPLIVDDDGAAVKGVPDGLAGSRGLVNSSDGHAPAKSMGWQEAHDIIMSWPSSRAMLEDVPSVYGYAGQNPLELTDQTGQMVGGLSKIPGSPGVCESSNPNPNLIPVVILQSCQAALEACRKVRDRRVCAQAYLNCANGVDTIFSPGLLGGVK